MAQTIAPSPGARLKQLIHRKDKVLVVLHPPTATHASGSPE